MRVSRAIVARVVGSDEADPITRRLTRPVDPSAMMAQRRATRPALHSTGSARRDRALLDLPVGRGEEANAVRHAREKQQAGSFGEAHQLLRQIERAADLAPLRAFAALRLRRPALARRGCKTRRLSRAARHPVCRGQIVRREALHDARIGEEGLPALVIERLELLQGPGRCRRFARCSRARGRRRLRAAPRWPSAGISSIRNSVRKPPGR